MTKTGERLIKSAWQARNIARSTICTWCHANLADYPSNLCEKCSAVYRRFALTEVKGSDG